MAILTSDPFTPGPEKRPDKKRKKGVFWLWRSFRDDLRNFRGTLRRLGSWWQQWRKTANAVVLLAFIVLYGVLAVMRKPSEVMIEQSRHAEEISFLQDYLHSYCAAGGGVLAERPHGGAELYPRGVLLQGEILDTFNRAPLGEVFVVHVRPPAWNPVEGFYGFPPIYVGGVYFHLERKFNLALYRCSFLIRKDTPQAGTMLLARVDLIY